MTRGLGYRFRDLSLLEEALTHGSYKHRSADADYERLEFLGDAALGLVVTETMHFQRPRWSGHERQETKSEIVSNQSLAAAALALSLDRGIRVGAGRTADVALRSSDRILANVFEAVLGAAYLDGGVPAARDIVGHAFEEEFRRHRLRPPHRRAGTLARALASIARLPDFGRRAVRRLLLRGSRQERALCHTFARPNLLEMALRSTGGRRSRKRRRGRQRGRGRSRGDAAVPDTHALRFLGRDVMQLAVSEALHLRFPDWNEGRMTLARMRLKERGFMTRLSGRWSLGGGPTAVASAEAVFGALYLDGRLKAARRALAEPLSEGLADLEDLRDPDLQLLDPKTRLQNQLAREGRELPRYEIRKRTARREGVAVNLRLAGRVVERGWGRSLKEAEKDAARRALRSIRDRSRRSGRRAPRATASSETARVRHAAASPEKTAKAIARPSGKTAKQAGPAPVTGSSGGETPANPKGALQELLVKRDGRLPVYRVISEHGPDHEKTFVVAVSVGGRRIGRGSGPSKRKAEARAAAAALAGGA